MGRIGFPDLHQCQITAGLCLDVDECSTVAAVLAADLHMHGILGVFSRSHRHAPLEQIVHGLADTGLNSAAVAAGFQCGNNRLALFRFCLDSAGLCRNIGLCLAGIDVQSVPCQSRKCIYSNCIIFHHAHLTQCCLSFPDESDCSFRSHIPAAAPWKHCLRNR